MFSRVIRSALSVSVTAIALLAGTAASAESVQTIQTLDRVDVYNKSKVLEMEFDDPGRTFDFMPLGVTAATAAGFSACQVTSSQALYCVDGDAVRYWAKPAESTGNGTPLLNCADANLSPCTGLTVDLFGAIWLAGKKAGSYSLLKLVAKPANGICALPSTPLPTAPYCVTQNWSGGTKAFVDVSSVDGDVGAKFEILGPAGLLKGPGVLSLEEIPEAVIGSLYPAQRKTALFFPAMPSQPIEIASAARWGIPATGGEQLQSITLLQLVINDESRNFALATTSEGRILAVDTENSSPAFEIFDIDLNRKAVGTNGLTFCVSDAQQPRQQYGLRASSKSGRVYLTDRKYCQAVALESTSAVGQPFRLQNVQEVKNNVSNDLTFSTSAAYPPDASTIAPGIVVDLSTCGANCVLLSDKDGTSAASLSNVKLAVDSKSGMTLFQVKDIADCRWAPDLCAGKSNVVIDANGNSIQLPQVVAGSVNGPLSNANALFLNVTPLLPVEITALFNGTGNPPKVLPRMLISPQYRAQQQQGFLFEALFGITDDGVVFQGTFDLLFDVGKLAGNKLGCGDDPATPKPDLGWDVITTVSERVITAGGPGLLTDSGNKNRYVDTLVNTGCINPTQGSGERWSMYAYNLEIAPNKDDVFAQLLLTLFDDLQETQAELACKQVDTTTTSVAPLSSKVCSALVTQGSKVKSSLNKCYLATIQPKSSASKERCNTFKVQLEAYQGIVNGASIAGPDPANRLGELKARLNVLFHVYFSRFLPSIPANGFTLR